MTPFYCKFSCFVVFIKNADTFQFYYILFCGRRLNLEFDAKRAFFNGHFW